MKLPVAGEERALFEKYGRCLFSQDFTLPNGKKEDFVLLRTSKNTSPVIVLPITKEGNIIAIRQFRYGANEIILELPGGNPKPGQTPEDVLFDELSEETGYRPGTVRRLAGGLWFEPATVRMTFDPFIATGCFHVQDPKPDPFELIEVVEIPVADWLQKIQRGEIVDSKSLAVTMLALPILIG